MRKGTLGLLAYCAAGLPLASAQNRQEPLPLPSPGGCYVLSSSTPALVRFPSYAALAYSAYPLGPPSPAPAGLPSGYALGGDFESARFTPRYMSSQASSVIQVLEHQSLPLPAPPTGASSNTEGLPDGPRGLEDKNQGNSAGAPEGPPGEKLAAPKKMVPDSSRAEGGASLDALSPISEPTEPYMVGPVGTWKPSKGYCFYGTAEYLYWWIKAQPLPPNLSLSLSSLGTAPELTAQGTSGGRFLLGAWLSDRQDLGVEAGYFFLGKRTALEAQTLPGSTTAKPVFVSVIGESSLLSSSTSIWGAEVNLRYQGWRLRGENGASSSLTAYVDFLGGFRYVDLSENLTVNSSTLFGAAPALLSGALLTTSDSFGTHNHIFAGQVGADAGLRWGRLSFNAYTKVGFADNQQTVAIAGNTSVNGLPVLGNAGPGGFFAQPSNIGHFTRDQFAVMPEAGINLALKLGDHFRIGVGYSFLYLSSVVRPGDQIDITAGGATRPSLSFLGGVHPQPNFSTFNESGFWAQGISATLEVSY